MSGPEFRQGSIFGANKPSQPQQSQGERSIFGSQSAIFGSNPRRSTNQVPKRNVPQNPRIPGLGNQTSPVERKGSSMSDKTPSNRRNSNLKRGKIISPGAVNPRQSNAPVSMQVGEKVFQTWNQDTRSIPFPNTQSNQLMKKAMGSVSRQTMSPDNLKGFFGSKREGARSDKSPSTPEKAPRERRQRNVNLDQNKERTQGFRGSRGRVCRFFLEGKCKKGDECEFEHKLSPNQKQNKEKPTGGNQSNNKSWYNLKSNKQPQTFTSKPTKAEKQDISIDQDIDIEEDVEVMNEEQEEEKEKDFDSVDEHKDQVDSLGSDPSFGEINRGKNLRELLTNIKKKETPSFKSKSELGSEIDVESNSDTFGQTHKLKIIRKRQPIRLSDNTVS